MTDIRKIEIPLALGSTPKAQLEKLTESVNLLQGVTDQDQRAVRMFEFNQYVAAMEARLKAAGIAGF